MPFARRAFGASTCAHVEEQGMAKMSEKFRDMGGEVYVEEE